MKISKRQLKQLIREAIAGHVHGDPEKEAFLDRAVRGVQTGELKKASNAIMDSFMIDDVWPEEEQALLDMLASLPAGARPADIEAVADQWTAGKRSGEYRA